MFCPKCGTKALDGAGFCQKCGTKLIADASAQPATPNPVSPTQPAGKPSAAVPKKKKQKKNKKRILKNVFHNIKKSIIVMKEYCIYINKIFFILLVTFSNASFISSLNGF